MLAASPFAQAQWETGPRTLAGSAAAPNKLPPILTNVGIDQKLEAQVPLDLPFRDETGQTVTLRKYFNDKPIILSLVYFNCTDLCPELLQGLTSSLRLLKFDIGKDYEVLTVSFDPRDGPPAAAREKAEYLSKLNKPGAQQGWHFLTGNQDSITALTQAVGFRYKWDAKHNEFAHATAIMILTPQGRVSKYFYGITYPVNDLRFGLIEASHNKIGTPVDQIFLFCCRYNPTSGKYDLIVSRVLAIAGAATILILGSLLWFLFRAGPRKHQSDTNRQAAA